MPQSPTPNMLLVQPSENGDSGVWDTLLTTLFLLIDGHDHSSGKGVKVKPNGLTIDADLSMASAGSYYALKDCKAIDLEPRPASEMTAYAGLFFNSSDSNNLYCRTASGTNVRITNGTTLDLTVVGGIVGDYAAAGAEVAFSDSGQEYTFKRQGSPKPWARLHSGPVRIAEHNTTETTYVEVAAPAALAGTYTVTFDTALPGSTQLVQIGSSGLLTYSNTIANAVSLSSALNANGGVTCAAGQHVTLSGSGRYRHEGRRRFRIATSGTVVSGTPTPASSGEFTGIGQIHYPLDSNDQVSISGGQHDRLLQLFYYYDRGGAGTLTFTVKRKDVTTGTTTTLDTQTVTTGTGYTSVSTSGLNHQMTAGHIYWVQADMSNAANIFHGFQWNADVP